VFEQTTLNQVFEKEGLLAKEIVGYQCRKVQLYMARLVERALEKKVQLIVEAGTGTGKTFAYLVPALLSDQKIVISTGTKNLQDQLYHKDLPTICKTLKTSKKIALLKGRANYLCLYRLDRSLHEGLFHSKQVIHELHEIQRWGQNTETGDFAELTEFKEDSQAFPYVTSSTDNCLGKTCPNFKHCFVLKARQKAQKADLIVVNHHLFFADLLIKEEDFGELLPSVNSVIFDEAHQLPEITTHFFGESFSSRQVHLLAEDIQAEYVQNAKDVGALQKLKDRLDKTIKDGRLAFGLEGRRGSWAEIKNNKEIMRAIELLRDELTFAEKLLKEQAARSQGLENCWMRAKDFLEQLERLSKETTDDSIHWFETFKKHFSLNVTPMQVGQDFIKRMQQYPGSWVFTSATLTADNNFHYFQDNLALFEAKTFQLTSPFDYKKNALIYIPKQLPSSNSHQYTEEMIKVILPVLKASRGRAFLLFTSFKALYEAETLLRNNEDYSLFVQGVMPKTQLLEEFRKADRAVLLGTQSFWEGVDVRGEALSCVIIDKLPFASPGDPILKAKIEKLREKGQDPFNEYQLPKAVLNLKQGIGRLIRDETDRGVLVICDTRIIEKPYGKAFLKSLPVINITREIKPVEDFFVS
jgi:ATP-dependent DNA helicase DinG